MEVRPGMTVLIHKGRVVQIPDIEVLAAFRMSRNTAIREGFPRTAAQVQGYLNELEGPDYVDVERVV